MIMKIVLVQQIIKIKMNNQKIEKQIMKIKIIKIIIMKKRIIISL